MKVLGVTQDGDVVKVQRDLDGFADEIEVSTPIMLIMQPGEDGPKRLDCESGFGACMTVTATFGLVAVSRVLERLAAPPKPAGGG